MHLSDRFKASLLIPLTPGSLAESRTHRHLVTAQIAMLVVALVLMVVTEETAGQIVLAVLASCVLVVVGVHRLGYLDLARALIPGCLYPFLVYNVFTGYGVHSLAVGGLIAMVMLAALFGGTGLILVYSFLSVCAVLVAFFAERQGIIQTPLGPSPINDLVEVMLTLVFPTLFMWIVMRDRQADQDVLLESSDRLRLLAENARDFIWTADLDLNYTYVSPSCYRLTGYTPEELMHEFSPLSITTEEEASRYREQFAAELAREWKGFNTGITLTSRLERKDGEQRWVETSFGFIFDEQGQPMGVVGASRDITERIELEEKQAETFNQLRQAQRMESIGQLAGGIAHDFNNLLLAIHGYAELIRFSDRKEEIKEYVEELLAAAHRASNLTKQLLMFSRHQALEVQDLDLLELVRNMITLISRLVPASISLRIVSDPGRFPIAGDTSQIEQVIMNLCVNARDAIEGGGEIELGVAAEFLETHANLPRGNYIRLDIKDTGCGIAQPVLDRIFDPFFTTKPVGEGTGLGMSVVHGIVKEHGGWVEVKSTVGEGTIVSVWFPEREDVRVNDHVSEQETSTEGDGQTILVVDDDAQVRSVVSRLLIKAGYRIIEASNGREGLEAFRRNRDNIALVVSDIVMPEMSGREFAQQAEVAGSDVTVVFMSGYRGEDSDFSEDYPFVAKPFSANELLRLVNQHVKAPD